MPIDPTLEALLAQIPPMDITFESVAAQREAERPNLNALTAQLAEPYPDVASRELVTIPVEGGTIDLFIYKPFTEGPHIGYVFHFGGGFRLGAIDYDYLDGACRERCVGADAVVISVGYRLAPEHPFPTAAHDCYAALIWVAEHADELGIDPARIVVGGQSSGGNLAAAVTLQARAAGGPAIARQVLEVPALDLTWETASSEYDTGYILERKELNDISEDLFTDPADARNPLASPIFEEDLTGLPSAVILTSEYDLVRGSAEIYAHRLEEAGVPVEYHMAAGQIHASSLMTKVLGAARVWRTTVIEAIRAVQ